MKVTRILLSVFISLLCLPFVALVASAQEDTTAAVQAAEPTMGEVSAPAADTPPEAPAEPTDSSAPEPQLVEPTEPTAATEPAAEPDYEALIRRAEMEKAQAEAERARWEAEKAKAEAQRAKIEAEQAQSARHLSGPQPEAIPEPDPGYHRHDGFYLRLLSGPGVGFHSGSGSIANGDVGDYDGTAYAMWTGQLALGGAVKENHIVYAAFWGQSSFVADRRYSQPSSTINGYGGVNLGVTYYIMPANAFIGGEIGPAFGSYRVYDPSDYYPEDYNYDPLFGLGLRVLFGKEWWVSANWGLGVAVSATYTYLAYDPQSAHLGGVQFCFSATYN